METIKALDFRQEVISVCKPFIQPISRSKILSTLTLGMYFGSTFDCWNLYDECNLNLTKFVNSILPLALELTSNLVMANDDLIYLERTAFQMNGALLEISEEIGGIEISIPDFTDPGLEFDGELGNIALLCAPYLLPGCRSQILAILSNRMLISSTKGDLEEFETYAKHFDDFVRSILPLSFDLKSFPERLTSDDLSYLKAISLQFNSIILKIGEDISKEPLIIHDLS